MNTATSLRTTGFWRLTWKEYRAIRLFWLSLVVLVGLFQWLTVAVSQNQANTLEIVFNLALGAPAFFAIGCAGATFAVEREEGTFEFLRAAPVSAGQVLASKLTVAVLATVAMFVVLWPLALLFASGQLPTDDQWHGMLGLWLVAAVEAIAWGTLFSLLGARPLVAVVLALVAVSTCTHLLAWTARETTINTFEWLSYLRAAPRRGLLALVVLGADVYLGLHWLHGNFGSRKKRDSADRTPVGQASSLTEPAGTRSATDRALQPLLAKRDRGAMFGHLLWQHWRQSRRLILIMGFLYVGLLPLGNVWLRFAAPAPSTFVHQDPTVLTMAVLATLMGAMVFLPDQEQRRYRFLAEHNAPPRLVWLTRQLIWILVLLVATSIICLAWLFIFGDGKEVLRILQNVTDEHAGFPQAYNYSVRLPSLGLGISIALVAYAVGQWTSMLVRSGIMAGFFGLLLSGILYGWVSLMHAMQVSFLWSVMPIPLVLLWATWLRAPDWIGENKRWSARGRLSAAVLVPAIALLIAVPVFRVHQVPNVAPGFEPAQYEAEIEANLAAGMATADMYRRASDLLSRRPGDWDNRETSRTVSEADQHWLKENSTALTLLLEASLRPDCIWGDPRHETELPFFGKKSELTQLMLVSGRQLEGDDNLDAALDRFFATTRVASHMANVEGYVSLSTHDAFHQLRYWGAQKGQTRQRIASALERLQAMDSRMLRFDEILKSDYILGRRMAIGDRTAPWFTSGYLNDERIENKNWTSEILWLKLMPWERNRALRVMSILTQAGLRRLQGMRVALDFRPSEDKAPQPIVGFCLPQYFPPAPHEFFETKAELPFENRRGQEDEWLETTVPDVATMGYRGVDIARRLAWFETDRRATMTVLALESYRLVHGELPKSLSELAPEYLNIVPLDPYSGREFVYFPEGLTAAQTEIDAYADMKKWRRTDDSGSGPIELGVPAIWSTGPDLLAYAFTQSQNEPDSAASENGAKPKIDMSYGLRRRTSYERNGPIWVYGDWFEIPYQPQM